MSKANENTNIYRGFMNPYDGEYVLYAHADYPLEVSFCFAANLM